MRAFDDTVLAKLWCRSCAFLASSCSCCTLFVRSCSSRSRLSSSSRNFNSRSCCSRAFTSSSSSSSNRLASASSSDICFSELTRLRGPGEDTLDVLARGTVICAGDAKYPDGAFCDAGADAGKLYEVGEDDKLLSPGKEVATEGGLFMRSDSCIARIKSSSSCSLRARASASKVDCSIARLNCSSSFIAAGNGGGGCVGCRRNCGCPE